MKTRIMIVILSVLTVQVWAQDQVQAFIKEAQDFYTKKEYKQAQMSLQDAINELNNLMSGQLVDVLPAEINGLKAIAGESGGSGMGMYGGGMAITKKYENPTKRENEAEVNILANSPMLQAISMYMGNPSMMGQGYKAVRVGTTRAIMKTENQDYYDDNGTSKPIRSSEVQIPLNQTLITINLRGFATEADELAFVTKLDLEKIKTALGE